MLLVVSSVSGFERSSAEKIMSIVKVSVEGFEGGSKDLYDYDKSVSLEDNIKLLIGKTQFFFPMPTNTHLYGLKIHTTNNGKHVGRYITEENSDDIKDGYFLKLVYSVSHQVHTIFQLLENGDEKTCFEQMKNLCPDLAFIKELVKQQKHTFLMDHFTNHQNECSYEGTIACLTTLIHLIKKQYIEDISIPFLDKIMKILECDTKMHTEKVMYALSVLEKILSARNKYQEWKAVIIRKKPLRELTPYIRSCDIGLQNVTLLLIVSMAKYTTGKERKTFIKEMNFKQTKDDIYNCIIQTKSIDELMERNLYLYQTFLLGLYTDALKTPVILDSARRKEFNLDIRHRDFANRLTTIMAFDDNILRLKQASMENILEQIDESCSNSTDDMLDNNDFDNSGQVWNLRSDIEQISYLTLEALRCYKKYHYKNFHQTQIDENICGRGIFKAGEQTIQMLATILDIGKEPNTSKPKLAFQPIFFDTSRKVPFFLELFSRSLWLLSKTKNEMKATTNKETIKVMKVLEKQVTMVLEKRPRNFQELTNLMIKTNYEVVKKQWQNEHEEEFKSVLDTNPAVQELKQEFLKLNDKVMVEQRMNFMKNGSVFNRLIDAKKYDHCFIELTENRKQFLIYDYDEKQKLKVGKPEIIMIPTIDYLVQGKACPHPTNTITKDLRLVFSLITELKRYINLVANNLKNAFYWTDGFNILLEKEPRSEIYNEELQELVKMDLSLHLLDLQDITIPKQAPRIPTSPYVIEKPPLPQKSPGLLALKRPKYMTKSKETGKCQNLIDDIYI